MRTIGCVRLAGLAAFVLTCWTGPSVAASFVWTPANPNIVVEAKALRQTSSGVTARVQAYTVEYLNSTIRTFGPHPTSNGNGGLKIFGVDVRRLGFEQLGLLSQPSSGVAVSGSDVGAGGAWPGFDSLVNPSYRVFRPGANRMVRKLEMALFSFSQAIRINSIKVDDVSNFDRDIWVAGCSSAPNFAQGLVTSLSGCTIRNRNDNASDGPFTHQIGLSGVRHLVVGARPVGRSIGRIAAGVPGAGMFFIDAINFTK
jgi:hypothetical protein